MHHFFQEVFPDSLPPKLQTSLNLLPQVGVLDPHLEPQPLVGCLHLTTVIEHLSPV